MAHSTCFARAQCSEFDGFDGTLTQYKPDTATVLGHSPQTVLLESSTTDGLCFLPTQISDTLTFCAG